jgi:hypothetical protein
MARSATARNGKLWAWDDNDNPGAGSKGITVDAGGVGLNSIFETLDYLFDEHNVDGTHKDDKINGNVLKSTVADGSTLETSAGTGAKSIRIKDAGVTTTKIADLAVTTAKIAADAVDSTKLKDDASVDANRAVTTDHIRDSAITTAKIAAAAVTAAKLSSELGWQWIYGDSRVAGTSAGNTPSAVTEWTETSKTPIVKLSFFLPQLSSGTTRKLWVRCNAKTDLATRAWNIQLNDSAGSVLASDNGVNTSYDGTGSECYFSYTITDSAQSNNIEYQISVYVGAGVSGTLSMKNLCVFITPS